jgi:hypothetical protein
MKLENPFPQRVRLLYLYVYACFGCGRSDRGLELHHIFGREYACAFNACPLCKDCHVRVAHNREEHSRYFFRNALFLLGEKYVPQEDDLDLIRSEPWLAQEPKWKKVFGAVDTSE